MLGALRSFGVQQGSTATHQHRQRPPLTARLAAFYYTWSFGLFQWIWTLLFFLIYLFPPLILPSMAYAIFVFSKTGIKPTYDASWPTPFRKWGLWQAFASYFPHAQLHKTADIPPNKPCIFAYHPHGVLATCGWLCFGTCALGFQDTYPGLDVRVLTLNINFRAPFLREYLLLHGVCSVARSAVLKILHKGKSVFIAVGGGSESLLARPGHYDLILRRRRGFVRCALQTGASLVPVIGFGEPETFYTSNSLPRSSRIRRFQYKLEKALGFTLPLAYGEGLFLPWGLLPRSVPLDVVIGAPIAVEKHDPAPLGGTHSAQYEALVDKYHKIYTEALLQLFHEHKEKFAKDAADMRIVE